MAFHFHNRATTLHWLFGRPSGTRRMSNEAISVEIVSAPKGESRLRKTVNTANFPIFIEFKPNEPSHHHHHRDSESPRGMMK